MERIIIAAVAFGNHVIGKDNDLIWRLPADMRFFKETTTGHYVIMGRRNFDSIPKAFRPLVDRKNVIVTRQKKYQADNCDVVNTVEEAISLAKSNNEKKAFIIGGGQIYKYALENDLVDKMLITWVYDEFVGDTFFPIIDPDKWEETERESFKADEKNPHDFDITTYVRK